MDHHKLGQRAPQARVSRGVWGHAHAEDFELKLEALKHHFNTLRPKYVAKSEG